MGTHLVRGFPFPLRGKLTRAIRKLVIIGDGACGKTSLLSVFTLGYFPTVSPRRYPTHAFELSSA